jgi:hypothetical protein
MIIALSISRFNNQTGIQAHDQAASEEQGYNKHPQAAINLSEAA